MRDEGVLREEIGRAPESPEGYLELAALLAPEGRGSELLALLGALLARRPTLPWAWSLKAALLLEERRVQEALTAHETLLQHAPDAAIPWMNYAYALKSAGRSDEAVAAYRKSLSLAPANGFAWWGLADMRTGRLSVEDAGAIERALCGRVSDLNRVLLHFALGRTLGGLGRFEQSFHHYAQANRLRGALVPYDANSSAALVDKTKRRLTADFFKQRRPSRSRGSEAIFIVGMPRSGSTLLEQILGSHPLIEGTGELLALPNAMRRIIGAEVTEAELPRRIAELTDDELAAMGELYLELAARQRRAGRRYFTDKLPSNWRLIGLIHLILPNAKIIDMRRQAQACCTSCFMTYFNRQTSMPTSLQDIARYYRDYVHAMEHLDQALPGRIERVFHEELVQDVEGVTRRLLAAVGLPFDAQCLRFDQNSRPVFTPSAQQVRVPINRHGMTFWRNYRPWLRPLEAELSASRVQTHENA